MKKMEILETDMARVTTLLSALKRGKWELEGDEVLAFAQVFAWASELKNRLKAAQDTAETEAKPETLTAV